MSVINPSTQLKRIVFHEKIEAMKEKDAALKNQMQESLLFQSAGKADNSAPVINKQGATQDLNVVLQLGLMNSFSNDSSVAFSILVGQMLEVIPGLAKKQETLFDELDKNFASDEVSESEAGADGKSVNINEILSSPELSDLTPFQSYVLLNEYVLTKKRKKRKSATNLSGIEDFINDLEENNSVDIIKNLQGLNKKSMEKIGLIKEFYNTANSYHAEYAQIIEGIEANYAKDFKKALKDIIGIHSYNLMSAKKDEYGSIEQKNRLWHNSQFEFKLLNLLDILIQFDKLNAKLDPQLQGNVTSMCQNFIDLMDGFDFSRIINNMLKRCNNPELKNKMSNLILNTNLTMLREMPEKFFKNDTDRDNTLKKLLATEPVQENNVMRKYF